MVKVFEVCPLDRQLLNNTTKVVLRTVTYFLVGCIRFIDVMALGSLSLSRCCSEQSACGKMEQLLAKAYMTRSGRVSANLSNLGQILLIQQQASLFILKHLASAFSC